MKPIFLRTKDLIDPETGIHYAYHKSLASITFPHNHDFFEIFLITKGKALHKINDKEEIIDEGTMVFIRPDDTHSYERYNDENCELINIAFPASTLQKLLDYFGEGYNAERLLKPEYPPTLKLPEIDKDILIARFEGLNTIPRGKKSKIKSEFRILIAEIFSRYFREEQHEKNEDIPSWLLKLKDEMMKRKNFVAGINRMYELSDRSPEHLSRTFKKYFNQTPTDFLNHLKLNYAANLLANSDKTISEISLDAGFENLSHFYHLFKREFGMAPKDFRNRNQKIIIPF